MEIASLDGRHIGFNVLGSVSATSGWPTLILCPGMRLDQSAVRPLAEAMADDYRVVVFDRSNTGASDLRFDPTRSEAQLWAEDINDLLDFLGVSSAFIAGISLGAAGCYLAARQRPERVRGLMLSWITGGDCPRERLATALFGSFREAVERGGMAAVAETDFFRERIAANPRNEGILAGTAEDVFLATLARWEMDFRAPSLIIPVRDDQLDLTLPVQIIAGADEIHLEATARALHRRLPHAEYHDPPLTEVEWEALRREGVQALARYRGRVCPPIYRPFIERCLAASPRG